MNLDLDLSLEFNPFAIGDAPESSTSDVSFISEPETPLAERRMYRRGSLLEASASSSTLASTSRHSRAQTESELPTSHTSSHPLRSAGLASGPGDAGITRPHLARMVDVGILVDAPVVEIPSSSNELDPSPEEKLVLVHEITSKDSLAGVALRYGIGVGELRKANQLWASDSIHLRKVLYIPIDKSKRAVTEPHSSEANLSTVHRIPASRLSFFPPPTNPTRFSDEIQRPDPIPYPIKPKSGHNRYATTPSQSLNSILTALPIAASTRDTIIARLSFDSASSSYSDHERHEEEDEASERHELDDVNATRHRRFSDSQKTPKPRPTSVASSKFSLPPSPTHSKANTVSLNRLEGYDRDNSLIGPPRTVQLEPSPAMRLPLSINGPRPQGSLATVNPKRRPRLIDVDFDSTDGSS
ncbi:peptidoglycan-binding LysM domain protein [Mycena floridula]|nr:peptidoglycan-binding LysM domain protein [Mycena floridula]